ncbi:MAG: hypothetical protein ACT6QU_04165 [Aliihoeflea sp.]|uniref:hypothetical protein n=1 Tax=Aliihoeflea sp. TaxID=2608088 RepID=UPI00403398D9
MQISPGSRDNGRRSRNHFIVAARVIAGASFLSNARTTIIHGQRQIWPSRNAGPRFDEIREATMTVSALRARSGQMELQDDNRLRDVIDAVFEELGLSEKETPRRAVVEERMRDAYRRGPRHNLNLVDAGLRA